MRHVFITAAILLVAVAGERANADPETSIETAVRHLEAKEFDAALRDATVVLSKDSRDVSASKVAGQALFALGRYAEAASRLRSARSGAGPDADLDGILAMACFLDAERNAALKSDAVRERRREAIDAAARAIAAGASSTNLYAVRAISLRRLNQFSEAKSAAAHWAAIAPEDAGPWAEDIAAADSRWTLLDAAVDHAGAAMDARELQRREDALLKKFGPATKDALAPEIDELLAVEARRDHRAQLVILRAAARISLGAAELAILDAQDAGLLDDPGLAPVARAVRRFDPSHPADDSKHLDGATPPERLSASAPAASPRRLRPGEHVSAEFLFRVDPDGRVSSVYALIPDRGDTGKGAPQRIRAAQYRPAMRDGRPVSVPLYAAITVMQSEVTVSGTVVQ